MNHGLRNTLLQCGNNLLAMRKKSAGEVLAHNLKTLMQATPDLSSGPKLEKASGVSQKTINNMTAGRFSTTIASIEGVARAFGLEPYQLLCPVADKNVLEVLRAYSQTDDRGRELLLSAADAVTPGKHERADKTGAVNG